MWRPDATLVNSPSLTLEEVEAIVDEAPPARAEVACHTYRRGRHAHVERGGRLAQSSVELDGRRGSGPAAEELYFVPTSRPDLLEKADLRETGGRTRACA